MYSTKILLLVFRSLLIFSLPLIFTLLAASISHFLTAAMTFSCFSYNEIRLLCLQSLTLTLSLFHVSVHIKNNVEEDTTLLLFFLSKSPGGHAFSCQIKPWVAFGLPYLLFEFFLHWRACAADGWAVGLVDVWSCDYQSFSDALVTEFSYSLCSTARASRAKELRYELPIRYVTLHFRIRSIDVFRALSRSYVWIEALCGIVFPPARKLSDIVHHGKRCLNLGDIALLTLVALFGNSRRVTGKWLKRNFHAGWQEMNLAAKKNTRKAIDAVWSSSVSDDSGKRTAFLSNLETNRLHSR